MTSAAEAVNTMYQAMATGDIPAALAVFAPDIEWTEATGFPYAGTFIGPDAVLQNVFARLGTEWTGFKAVPETIVADGDQVAAIGWYSGAYGATGKEFRARYVHWFTVSGGLITRFEQVCDTAEVAAALS